MADAAAARLFPGSVLLSNPVRAIQRELDSWRVITRDSATEVFDTVILATSAPAAGDLLEGVDGRLSHQLRQIPYSSSATVALGYDTSA